VSYGVLIWQLQPGGPAANAGLRGMARTDDGSLELGDIIVGVDGEKINDNDELYKVLNKHQIGDSVNIDVYRGSRRMTVGVRLNDIPAQRRNVRE
jgi:S1-C subfamily serine protease